MPVEIFCCYAHEDQSLLILLKAHLMSLQRQGLITLWSDTDINAGVQWEEEINKHLNTAQIILLLVSPDFMASDYCYSKEMKCAIERHESGEAFVIPVILRPVYWQIAPFGKLQVLPSDAKPITDPDWHNIDRAFFSVVEGLNKVVESLITNRSVNPVILTLPPSQLKTKPELLSESYGFQQFKVSSGQVSLSDNDKAKKWDNFIGFTFLLNLGIAILVGYLFQSLVLLTFVLLISFVCTAIAAVPELKMKRGSVGVVAIAFGIGSGISGLGSYRFIVSTFPFVYLPYILFIIGFLIGFFACWLLSTAFVKYDNKRDDDNDESQRARLPVRD